MATLAVPNTIANGIAADGANVEANFTSIETFANTEVVHRDGAVAMTAPLSLVAPVSASHAARKQDVDAAVPIGTILPYGGNSAPTNYLLCQGQAVSRATYATLFTVLGTNYGAGDGSTTFNLPNLTGRVPLGLNAGGAYGTALGATGGAADATLVAHNHTGTTATSSGDHSHNFSGTTSGHSNDHVHSAVAPGGFLGGTPSGGSYTVGGGTTVRADGTTAGTNADHTHTYSGTTGGMTFDHNHSFTTASSGSSATNANLQPFQVVNYMVKAL